MIGIEALSFHSLRQGQHGAVFVIINFSDAAQTIPLPGPMKRCPGRGEKTSLHLPVYGVAVLSPAR